MSAYELTQEVTTSHDGKKATGTIRAFDYDRKGRIVGLWIELPGRVVVWRSVNKRTGRIQ